MSKLFSFSISKEVLMGLLALFSQMVIYAQEETVTDNKGNIIEVRNTRVTTAATAPGDPLQNDIWFDTTADLTKIYDGTTWLVINADALASKEDAANKSTDVTLADATDTEFPTELAVKTYVDGEISTVADDFVYQGLTDTHFPYYDGTRFIDGRIRQQNGKITMNGAADKYAFNVFGTGLTGRMFFHGNAGDNPGVELATDPSGSRRVLMRLNESGSAGTEIAFYTRPDSGGAVRNYWTLKNDGVLDFDGKGIRKNGNQLQYQRTDNTWQDFDDDDDNQDLSLSGTTLSLTGDASPVNLNSLSGPWDNPDGTPANRSSTALKFNGPVAINKNSNQSGYTLDVNGQIVGDVRLELRNEGVENSHMIIFSSDTETNLFRSDRGNILRLQDTGQLIADNYGDDTFNSSTYTRLLGVEADGAIVEVNPSNSAGHAFYEVGTTRNPNNINDNIYTQGNVGIGTATPGARLHINETVGTVASATAASLLLEHEDDGGTSSIVFQSRSNVGSDFGYMQFTDDGSSNGSTTENSLLEIGVQNDDPGMFQDDIALMPSGLVGIGTRAPSAKLDIESEGVPFEIKPSTTTPTGTQAGQIFMGNDGILYAYDGSRSKWLSVNRSFLTWGKKDDAKDDYLRQMDGAESEKSGWRIIRNATITAISIQTEEADESYTLEIRKNNGTAVIASLNINFTKGGHRNNVNANVNEGDYLQAYINGEKAKSPQALVEIAWRK